MLEYADLNIPDGQHNVLPANANEFLRTTVIKHIAKLQALNVPVHSTFFEAISSNPDYKNYFQECAHELLRMKNEKIKDSWLSFLNILGGSTKKLKNYAGNENVINDCRKSHKEKKFPIYNESIKINIDRAVKIRKQYDKSAVSLSKCLPIFNPHHLIIRDILDCLVTEDSVDYEYLTHVH